MRTIGREIHALQVTLPNLCKYSLVIAHDYQFTGGYTLWVPSAC